MTEKTKKWLNSAMFYQIYPTSYYDCDNNGIGDINGITKKLDYIADLGCNGIWINPCFMSEFRDGGYDIVDYYKVDQRLGTNAEIKKLFEEAHKKGIKVLLDLVVGHTSDKCEWFIKSAQKEKNEYSDYYIWTDNVWDDSAGLKMINGATERDGNYMVNFFAMQPALNFGFAHPCRPWQKHYKDKCFDKMHNLVCDIIEFWMDMGADGFRVDMAGNMIKNDYTGEANTWFWNKIFSNIKVKYPDAVFIAEWSIPEISIAKAGFDMDFMIHLHGEGYSSLFRWEREVRPFAAGDKISYFRKNSLTSLEIFFSEYYKILKDIKDKGFISIPTGNHDISRISYKRTDAEIITAYAFLFTIPNVPFIYYGDEIGMRYIKGLSKDGGYDRTGSRTPMQWDDSKNCGFSTAEQTYLPVFDDLKYTVKAQNKAGSILSYTKELIMLKKTFKSLMADSEFNVISAASDNPFIFERIYKNEKITVAINAKGGKAEALLKNRPEKVLSSLNSAIDGDKIIFSDFGYIILAD